MAAVVSAMSAAVSVVASAVAVVATVDQVEAAAAVANAKAVTTTTAVALALKALRLPKARPRNVKSVRRAATATTTAVARVPTVRRVPRTSAPTASCNPLWTPFLCRALTEACQPKAMADAAAGAVDVTAAKAVARTQRRTWHPWPQRTAQPSAATTPPPSPKRRWPTVLKAAVNANGAAAAVVAAGTEIATGRVSRASMQ